MIGKWTFTLDEEHWTNDDFDTKEEAILAGQEYYAGDYITKFYVGQIFEPQAMFSAESVIDDVDEGYGEQCGDYADGWYKSVSKDDISLLQAMLDKTFAEWLEKTENKPSFYSVTNVEESEISV